MPPHIRQATRFLLNQYLFLLLQLLGDTERDLENLRHQLRGRQSKPLRQGDVRHSVRLVNLHPDEVFSVRRILNIMAVSWLVNASIML